jgi:hypothetical protein
MTRTRNALQISILAVAFLFVSISGASAGLKTWPTAREAGDAFFAAFINGSERDARKFINVAFDGQAKPDELVNLYRQWLGSGELHSIKLIRDDKLGEVLGRETYALQKVSAGLLFLQLAFVVTPEGWALYHIQFQSDIGKFFPGWRNPN